MPLFVVVTCARQGRRERHFVRPVDRRAVQAGVDRPRRRDFRRVEAQGGETPRRARERPGRARRHTLQNNTSCLAANPTGTPTRSPPPCPRRCFAPTSGCTCRNSGRSNTGNTPKSPRHPGSPRTRPCAPDALSKGVAGVVPKAGAASVVNVLSSPLIVPPALEATAR